MADAWNRNAMRRPSGMIHLAMVVGGLAYLFNVSAMSQVQNAPTVSSDQGSQNAEREQQQLIPQDWLDKKISVEEAEAAHPGIKDDRATRFPELGKPFGGLHEEWQALKDDYRAGDEIWTFDSSANSWKNLAGRGGVALVRGGKVIRIITTIMN